VEVEVIVVMVKLEAFVKIVVVHNYVFMELKKEDVSNVMAQKYVFIRRYKDGVKNVVEMIYVLTINKNHLALYVTQ